jgi:nucleoside-diphosphate-sugar epimerase
LRNTQHTVITGGAGFVGSHLCRALLDRGHRVTVIDNFCSAPRANITALIGLPGFTLREATVSGARAFSGLENVTTVVHLACPASPRAYMKLPVETLRAGSAGTLHVLELAREHDARAVVASSSEVYGDPLVHPQREDYTGNVDPIGPRSAYDEAKRFSEAATAAFHRDFSVNAGIVRPFNVYGPHMWPDDGRVVAAFCASALRNETLYLHNGGTQTRSLLYISDAVNALLRMIDSDVFGPVNIGSEDEVTIRELAELVVHLAGAGALDIAPGRQQDVNVRRPDTTRARDLLGWQASTPLREGLNQTLDWMRAHIQREASAA